MQYEYFYGAQAEQFSFYRIHTNDVEQLRREFLELKADYLERVVKLLRKIY